MSTSGDGAKCMVLNRRRLRRRVHRWSLVVVDASFFLLLLSSFSPSSRSLRSCVNGSQRHMNELRQENVRAMPSPNEATHTNSATVKAMCFSFLISRHASRVS